MNKGTIIGGIAATLIGSALIWAASGSSSGIAGWETLNVSMGEAIGVPVHQEAKVPAGDKGGQDKGALAESAQSGTEAAAAEAPVALGGTADAGANSGLALPAGAANATNAANIASSVNDTNAENAVPPSGQQTSVDGQAPGQPGAGASGGVSVGAGAGVNGEAGAGASAGLSGGVSGGVSAGAGAGVSTGAGAGVSAGASAGLSAGASAAAVAAAPPVPPPAAPTSGLINVNIATVAELMNLPGIGEKKAQAIIDYRNSKGAFRGATDLGKVKGIGPKVLEKLRPLVTF
ncbi:hypothetical protein A8L34_06705 [Bacillus sp. FJAT-27264]|uniref:ComEA family DNA-binding protein n=1 Tax=Paenibacillus sp. (strain DSM 101736 / FJAT-27264) TaxID=1850362 RepID=UPI000807F6B1|nr:helix-hairpin-helix domain-containing protein [Bacillus sp. FJAT-27264]OBZ19207.1 hypothetical protein A8L34_06705 [Bacillus sp. FJAT-27264]